MIGAGAFRRLHPWSNGKMENRQPDEKKDEFAVTGKHHVTGEIAEDRRRQQVRPSQQAIAKQSPAMTGDTAQRDTPEQPGGKEATEEQARIQRAAGAGAGDQHAADCGKPENRAGR
ncbi:hypothetical protein WR25_09465 [Diploscapter pachys]|uniref:Uncharacterized protein n=1 Tax=Diploscapter pachys TaxID=2018661 RepID=A0A2A2M5F7_9BILA|nr:hypothetical protein WR25_09465 [Diploscapter pachys]